MHDAPPSRYDLADPTFDPDVGARIMVKLDGQPCARVVAYDCEEGWVRKFQTTADGHVRVSPTRDEALKETVTGFVTAEWKD